MSSESRVLRALHMSALGGTTAAVTVTPEEDNVSDPQQQTETQETETDTIHIQLAQFHEDEEEKEKEKEKDIEGETTTTASPPATVRPITRSNSVSSHSRSTSRLNAPKPGGPSARRFSRQASNKKMKLTESWPSGRQQIHTGSHHIRRLFRLFDRDGSGSINPAEFRAGLASLGFDTGNIAQLKQLQQEMDVDGTGLIRESQFIHAFRTLNRKAIEQKLAASGATSGDDSSQGPLEIQLMKIGHVKDENGLQSSFHHQKNISPADMPEILRREDSESRDKAIRWYDICGLHQGIFALLSNHFLLPHEMLGEEIELEAAAHCDFFTSRPQGDGPAAGTGAGNPAVPTGPSNGSSSLASPLPHHLSRSPSEPDANCVNGAAVTDLDASASGSDLGAEHLGRESSDGPPPLQRTVSMGDQSRHNTMKILCHSLQVRNFPVEPNASGKLELVSLRKYRQNKVSIIQVPIHIIIVNDSTLITVRPKYLEKHSGRAANSGSKPTVQDSPGANKKDDTPSADDDEDDDDTDDPNDIFGEFISTLSDTDSTSMSSALGFTSAKILAIKLFEEVVDTNWSVRDAFKEWKQWLENHVSGEISDQFYLMQLNDYDRLANTCVRLLRPLLNTIAGLSGEHVDLAHTSESNNPAHSKHGKRDDWLTPQKDLVVAHARANYLKDVQTSLRLLHRNIARQYDQANLSLSLGKGLQEQYTQRGRDGLESTLYVLTVVTTIVTPLQIATGVYGMNWVNFPELSDPNGYYYFWAVNIALIVLIGLAWKFRDSVTWVRENLQ